ncbi:MAG: MATE family efflux transporter [Fretibacterium sp.]|nr:MATE family efflux transporter [Fretibacterium sp.]
MLQMLQPERMGREPILRLLVNFALPSIAGLLANSLYNFVDRMFVGRIVGPIGLAAISVSFPFMVFVIALGLLLGVGSVTLISAALGEKNAPRAELVLGNVVFASALLGGGVTFFGLANVDFLLRLSGAGRELLPQAREYMNIILMGVPFGMVAFVANFCVRAEGRPAFAMGAQVVGALANILLDALFIWGWGWGVAGAAWGTTLSQVLSMMWVLSFYGRRMGYLHLRLSNLFPRFDVLRRVLALGLSSCLTELSFSLFFVLFNRGMNAYGGPIALSALGVFLGWDSLLFLPVIGIADAVQALFGYNWGARLPARVLEALKWSLLLSAGYFAGSAVLVYLFAEEMILLFTDDPQLLPLAMEGMYIAYSGVILAGIALIANSFFQGLGRAGHAFLLSLTRQFLLLIPAILILPRIWGVNGVWACFPALDIGGGALALFLLLHYYKKLGLDRCEGTAAGIKEAGSDESVLKEVSKG